jgi:superfamily II DNA or RNA helicase
MLRQWQEECVELVLEKYHFGQPHFLCQATPGAGKTVMAAEVAMRLLNRDEVDLVLCFSPTLNVAENMQETLAWKLNCSFDGGLGSVGGSYTYQSLRYLSESFWRVIGKHRVLVIFDEIHHCSANADGKANVWGEEIVNKIQSTAKYTLALTGTPWRSDSIPIAMARYTDPEGQIICDYQYGLSQAIEDKVCRSPKLVLVDNDNLTVTDRGEMKSFSSILELIKLSNTSYQQLIHNREAIHYLLSLGCKKLSEIRRINPEAGGLIVAASVKHAQYIQKLLVEDLSQSTVLVTYQHDFPLQIIDEFRRNACQWIVSVGMISEGTDIPRLQVCCHLSAVKTELYFRQVLGRVLRVNSFQNQDAWLYTFAEENLVGFAERIEQDIPDTCQFIKFSENISTTANKEGINSQFNTLPKLIQSDHLPSSINWSAFHLGSSEASKMATECDSIRLGQFKKRIIDAFCARY